MVMQNIGDLFGWIMYFCYRIMHDYGLTIILFTFIIKIILLPISIIVQKNSIKLVKMYPQINRIKAQYFGNKDMISEEQYQLYKKEQYHPMLDLLPVVLQLVILMGVINVIYKPLRHLLHIDEGYIEQIARKFSLLSGVSEEVGSIQIQLISYLSGVDSLTAFQNIVPTAVLEKILSLDITFVGFNLGVIPIKEGGISIAIPIAAALSAWLLCSVQNKISVLQSEQGRLNKVVTLTISVGLSLYLGFFVPAGVGFYWMISNLLSIIQLHILNYFINPKKYIDYAALEESKKELEQLNKYAASSKNKNNPEYAALEKADYKRFMKYENKQLVFYSEKNGFYKYFKNVIELILKKTDITIHYITSDPHDEVIKLQNDNFRVYYIGENRLIVLMMKMDADMVVMTTPDLQKYQLKRSMVRNDIEYVYMAHGIGSANMLYRKHALDYFDTVFATNEDVYKEIRKQEEVYGLKKKRIVKYGYCLLDDMITAYESRTVQENSIKTILIAPSWQKDNIFDLCVDEILQNLLGKGYHVILRPHPQYLRHFKDILQGIETKYSNHDDFTLQYDFSANDTVFNADILITDWSGIAYEYSFTTLKPTLFIDTPMKAMNPDYEEIGITPFDIVIRNQIGVSMKLDELGNISNMIRRLLYEDNYSKDNIAGVRNQYIYNLGNSGEVGADYIIQRLIEYSKN